MKYGILILSTLLFFSFSTALYLGQLQDVSTIGAETGDVLSYNGRGWSPSTPINLTGIGEQEILYEDGDSISSNSQFLFDPTGGPAFGPLLDIASSGNQGQVKVTGSLAGWVSMGTPSNQWDFVGLTGELRIEPSSSEGTVKFRNAGGTDLFAINTTNSIVEVGAPTRFRLTGQTANAPTAFVAVDASDDMAIATQAEARGMLGIQRGAVSSSTDASGQISVGHGLSSTPTSVIVTNTTNDSWKVAVVAKNPTQFTVKFFDETGAVVATTSAGFDWIAIE